MLLMSRPCTMDAARTVKEEAHTKRQKKQTMNSHRNKKKLKQTKSLIIEENKTIREMLFTWILQVGSDDLS